MTKRLLLLTLCLGACAGHNANTEIKPQYAPLPGQEGEVLPVVVREAIATPIPVAAPVAMPRIETPPPPPVVVKPVRTLQMVTDSITAAWAGQLGAAESGIRGARETAATRQQEIGRLSARRPSRPAGMLTAQVVDAALEAENRWQQEVAVANRAVAEAEQLVRDREAAQVRILTEREAAYTWARNSFEVRSEPLIPVNIEANIEARDVTPWSISPPAPATGGRPATAPVKRKPRQ